MKNFNYLLIYILCFNLFGCTSWTNPTPDIINNEIISYDEGVQNGGIIQTYIYTENNTENKGFIITENAKNRYNALIKKYGNRFIPELKQDMGIKIININNKQYYFISAQHMVYFADMMDYYRLDKKIKDK